MRLRYLFIAVLSLVMVVRPQAQQRSDDVDIERIRRATVFITQAGGDSLTTYCVGTGTLVRYDGLILTNAHHVVQSEACPGDELIISMSVNPNEPPVPKYRADIAQVNEGLDLALLRITREEDGRVLEPDALPILPFVDIANVSDLELDDTITMVGYPSLGNDSVSSIVGTVTAFIAEPSGGEKSWIKTRTIAPVPGTMSGGGAYNQQGQLIGIPTSAPIRSDDGLCRTLEDSNRDGFINRSDVCIPIGDFISVLRPADFARPLVRSASLNLQVETLSVQPFRSALDDVPTVERLYFASSVNNGLPTRVIGSAPVGTTSLYAFFDYQNFTPDTVYEVRVNINGNPIQTFSLPPVRWSGPSNGLWYIGSSGQPFPNGTYEFRLFVDGIAQASRTIDIGGQPTNDPTFSNVVFGFIDENSNLSGESYVLPISDVVSARFIYSNLQPNTPWSAVWYWNDQVISRTDDVWEAIDGTNGLRDDVSIRPTDGLRPGRYRVDFGIGPPDAPSLVATGDFVVAGEAEGALPNVFDNIEFFRADSPTARPAENPATAYPDGANTLYARFDWNNIAPGTFWTMQWLVDDTIFYESTNPWNASDSGDDFTVRLTAPNGLPDGTYTLRFLINSILLEAAEVSIGIGQLEIDQLARVGDIQLRGQIVDGDTLGGIEGATFVLITEDFSIADFVWDQEQIYALAITDSNGNFEIDRPLEFDSPYSVYILAEGYLPITQDGFTITPELLEEFGGSPVDMYIPLTRG